MAGFALKKQRFLPPDSRWAFPTARARFLPLSRGPTKPGTRSSPLESCWLFEGRVHPWGGVINASWNICRLVRLRLLPFPFPAFLSLSFQRVSTVPRMRAKEHALPGPLGGGVRSLHMPLLPPPVCPTGNTVNSLPGGAAPPTKPARRKQSPFNPRPPAAGVYEECCQSPLLADAQCRPRAACGAGRRGSRSQRRVRPGPRCCSMPRFLWIRGLAGRGRDVLSLFLMFSRDENENNALRAVSEPSEESRVLLIPIEAQTRLLYPVMMCRGHS